jgi:hypothetical protein
MRTHTQLISFIASVGIGGQALAQGTPPDYGLTWRTVGDPGNPAAQPADYYWLQVFGGHPVGQENYTYRLTQTEVTNTQWIEFVDAYAHVNPSVINDPSFYGRDVYRASDDPAHYGWFTAPGAENAAAQMGWLYAARFCNWLSNGKVDQLWAFETGAYDMTTFHRLPSGIWEGQTTHAPNASFWIPSWDEWDKGMHWDPNKFGPGQGGYWLYPTSSDQAPVGGLPGTPGAQTSAGRYPGVPWYVPVGSYPTVQSPWGLLDGSGGAMEYLEGWDGLVRTRGTDVGAPSYTPDRLDYLITTAPDETIGGLRLASAVPAPGSYLLVSGLLVAVDRARDRRRPHLPAK